MKLPPFISLVSALSVVAGFSSVQAANVIVNGSFEDSQIILASGNNLNVVVPNWTITDTLGTNPNPTNLVKPAAGYAGGPDVAQLGIVYFDGNGTNVKLFQDFNIMFDQTVTYSGYFSRRDNLSALGNTIKILNSTGTTLLGSSNVVDIPNTLSQETWFLSSGSLALTAGNYRLQIDLPNNSNVDNVVLNAIPEPTTVALIGLSGLVIIVGRRRLSA